MYKKKVNNRIHFPFILDANKFL